MTWKLLIIDWSNNNVSWISYLSPPELFRLFAYLKAESASNFVTRSSTKSSRPGPFASFSFWSFVTELCHRQEIFKSIHKELHIKRLQLVNRTSSDVVSVCFTAYFRVLYINVPIDLFTLSSYLFFSAYY